MITQTQGAIFPKERNEGKRKALFEHEAQSQPSSPNLVLDLNGARIGRGCVVGQQPHDIGCQLLSNVGIGSSAGVGITPAIHRQVSTTELEEMDIAHTLLLSSGVQAGHVLQVACGLISCQDALDLYLQRKHLQDDLHLGAVLISDLHTKAPKSVVSTGQPQSAQGSPKVSNVHRQPQTSVIGTERPHNHCQRCKIYQHDD